MAKVSLSRSLVNIESYSISTLLCLPCHASRMPHHRQPILKALLQLIADLCPSNSVVPTSKGRQLPARLHVDRQTDRQTPSIENWSHFSPQKSSLSCNSFPCVFAYWEEPAPTLRWLVIKSTIIIVEFFFHSCCMPPSPRYWRSRAMLVSSTVFNML